MDWVEIMLVLLLPYVLATITAVVVQRINVLPVGAAAAASAYNDLGRLAPIQRRALLVYNLPEIVFAVAAVTLAIAWQPDGINGLVLRWGLVGMALVRLSLSAKAFADVLGQRVETISGPLRKIQFGKQRALAIENGPLLVLPVEQRLFDAFEANAPSTIVYTPHSRRVVALIPLHEATAQDSAALPVTGASA